MLVSSSGMPQHWQTNCRGEPNSVLMDTSNSLESSFKVSVLGTVSPVSQRETACRVTWTCCASCSWESPWLVRSSRRISFVSMSITTLPGLYHSRSQKQSNHPLLYPCSHKRTNKTYVYFKLDLTTSVVAVTAKSEKTHPNHSLRWIYWKLLNGYHPFYNKNIR